MRERSAPGGAWAARNQRLLERAVDGKRVIGTTFGVERSVGGGGGAERERWVGAAGGMGVDTPFFIASTTKLFTTALVLQQRARGTLRLEDPVFKWLGSETMQGLHRWGGREWSTQITCAHLLAHTSGLPDYLQDRPNGARGAWGWVRGAKSELTWLERLKAGEDWVWTAEDAMDRARQLQAHFAPGTPGRAYYSDLNYQLLGRVLEAATGLTYDALLHRDILQPLGLGQTYLYNDASDNRPETLRYQRGPLHIPLAMTSFGPDGGVVSTASDLLDFTRAFFDGTLFPLGNPAFGPPWNPIFFPLESGLGVHRFRVPRWMDPFRGLPTFVGHSGLSGTVAFHIPDRGITIVGTVNQVDHPDLAFRLMIRLAMGG